jgi:voltage-gated potassium channel
LSFINLVLLLLPFRGEINDVIFIIDKLTAIIFLADFLQRYTHATSKNHYILRQYGWSDLLAAIPITAFNIFRIFRVLRLFRAVRVIGLPAMRKLLKSRPADTALYSVFISILLLLEFGSIGILFAESAYPEANIKTASDAIWWVFVSITTVGYGDRFPVTDAGRLIGVVTLTVGVGLFGVVTGYLANFFLKNRSDNE